MFYVYVKIGCEPSPTTGFIANKLEFLTDYICVLGPADFLRCSSLLQGGEFFMR